MVPWWYGVRCELFTLTRLHTQKHLWHDQGKSSPAAAQEDAQQHTARTLKILQTRSRVSRVRCDVRVVSWFKLMGPVGIVLSARHKHSKPAGTSTKHTHSLGVLVRCMYSGLVGGLLFVARAVWLACVGRLVFVVCAPRGSLSRPWWVPRPCISVWCLDGTGCGVM